VDKRKIVGGDLCFEKEFRAYVGRSIGGNLCVEINRKRRVQVFFPVGGKLGTSAAQTEKVGARSVWGGRPFGKIVTGKKGDRIAGDSEKNLGK